MKSIKAKSLIAISASLILLSLLAGCSKKVTVTNDPELEKSLYGTWSISTLRNSEFWSGQDTDDEKFLGKATIRTENSMSFSENQRFEMKNVTTLETLTIHEDSYLTEDLVRSNIDKTVVISGSFSVDKEHLELRSDTVLVNDTDSYTAEEYSKIDNNFGSAVQIQKWKLSGNKLTVYGSSGKPDIEYEKQ